MIEYKDINWQLSLIFQAKGSVFPKALMWALPCTAICVGMSFLDSHIFGERMADIENHSTLVSLFAALTSVLGFLIVFRTHSAYGRYWEGITLLRTARGEWFNSYSSVLSFCSGDENKRHMVEAFQHQLARFMSILSCVALQTVTEDLVERFPTLDTSGLEETGMRFLASKRDPNHRMEILTQWIQRIIVEAEQSGLIIVSAPILSRSFQELSRGAVNLTRARNMTEVPFPFPYVQLVTTILVVHSCITPLLMNSVLKSSILAALVTFIGTFTFWGMNYIAAEIESPFGSDANDLPMHRLQEDFNASLWALLERQSQMPAKFSFSLCRDRVFSTRSQSFSMVSNIVVEASSGQVLDNRSASGHILGVGASFHSGLTEDDDRERRSRRPKLKNIRSLSSVGSASSWTSSATISGERAWSWPITTTKKKKPFTEAHSHVKPVLKQRLSSGPASGRCDSGDGGGDGGEHTCDGQDGPVSVFEEFEVEVSVGAGCMPRALSCGSVLGGASVEDSARPDSDSVQDAFRGLVPKHAEPSMGGRPVPPSRAECASPTSAAAAAPAKAATDADDIRAI